MSSVKTVKMLPAASCPYHKACSGCSLWESEYAQQLLDKKTQLEQQLFSNLGIKTEVYLEVLQPYALRDYISTTFANGSFGFYNKEQTQILDIQVCLQLSPELQSFYSEFIKIKPPINKGSLKLRIFRGNSKIKRGVWLDFANLDIKQLFAQKSYLNEILKVADEVEIGQRRKKLIIKNEQFKLEENPFDFWFQTYIGEKKYPLYSTISGFSQTGDAAIKRISEIIQAYLKENIYSHFFAPLMISEYGSGNGSLTLPFYDFKNQIHCYEFDQLTSTALQRTLQTYNLSSFIKIHSGDFQNQKKAQTIDLQSTDLIVLNPSRSGVKSFLNTLTDSKKPKHLFYMSCYLKSFLVDSLELKKLNYQLERLILVDQFPQTEHYEIISFWKQD